LVAKKRVESGSAVVRGTVLDADGRPVSRAQVECPGARNASSDREGAFELLVPPGEATLWAEREGHAPSAMIELVLAPGRERNGLLTSPATI
jgi:hypothetical protein